MKNLNIKSFNEILECDRYRESREEYTIRKLSEGFKIKEPDDDELLIDIDDDISFNNFKAMIDRFNSELNNLCVNLATFKIYNSSTPGHKHIVVKMPFNIDNGTRIALQLLLGSDVIREMLSMFRIWNGDKHPTLLAMKE